MGLQQQSRLTRRRKSVVAALRGVVVRRGTSFFFSGRSLFCQLLSFVSCASSTYCFDRIVLRVFRTGKCVIFFFFF